MLRWQEKKRRRKSISFYCITLALFCQALLPFSAFAVGTGANPTSASGSVNSFSFEDFTADYYLSKAPDGSSRLKVVEKFVALFPRSNQNHGITRVIPYTNQDGKNLTLPSDSSLDIKLKRNRIDERPYKIEPGDGYFTVYIGDPDQYVHDRQTYELEYEFRNVITNPGDNSNYQELYWDTNGNDWSQSFSRVTARIHLIGEDVQNSFTGNSSCYVGKYYERGGERCLVNEINDGIEFKSYDLSARENLTFDLEFKNHTFVIPAKTYDYRVLAMTIAELILGIIVIAAIVYIHRQTKAKREYYQSLFIVPEYAPPSGFTVAEMAANYVGKGTIISSKVATLMELAVSHKIILAKVGTEKKPQWTVQVLSTDISPEQTDVLKILTGRNTDLKTGQEILIKTRNVNSTLLELDRSYAKHIETSLLKSGLKEAKNTHKKLSSSLKNSLCGILTTFGILWIMGVICILLFMFEDIPSYVTLYGGIGLIVVMVVIAMSIAIMSLWAGAHYEKFYTHSEKGLKYSRYLEGLKLYIKMAEKDRIEFLQSVKGVDISPQGIVNLYEKLLPYAVIFNLETSWIKEMSKYYEMEDVSNPMWYASGAVFSTKDFNNAMRSVNSTVSTAIQHSSTSGSSSGFSGSGGGGFSGGGGGGGGGGGW